jgi:hypothetical protein
MGCGDRWGELRAGVDCDNLSHFECGHPCGRTSEHEILSQFVAPAVTAQGIATTRPVHSVEGRLPTADRRGNEDGSSRA